MATARDKSFAGYWLTNFGTLIIFWLIFSYLDFLGLEGALKEQSRELVDRIVSPFYGADLYAATTGGDPNEKPVHLRAQDKIAVVLLTDETATAMGTYHPMPFSFHELILERIMAHEPAAVFIDLDFRFERPGDTFKQLLSPFDEREKTTEGGFPLLFAGGTLDELAEMPGELKKYGTVVAWEDEPHQYPLLISRGGLTPDQPTAAMALFSRLCLVKADRQWAGCPQGIEASIAGTAVSAVYGDSLALRWGATAPRRQQVMWSTAKCPLQADATAWQRLRAAWSSILSKLFAGIAEDIEARVGDRNRCFYHLTIPPERLTSPRVVRAIEAEGLDPARNSPPMLKDRVVFYGSRVTAVHDYVTNAVHGQVPGVFAHAMAFDNLLTYGPGYIKGDEAEGGVGLSRIFGSYEFWLWCLISAALAVRPARAGRSMALEMAHGFAIFVRRSLGTIRMLIWPAPVAAFADWLGRTVGGSWPRRPGGVSVRLTVIVAQIAQLPRWGRPAEGLPGSTPAPPRPDGLIQRFQQGDMMLFAVILVGMFLLNEFWWRREVADWLGLALLYFLVTHVGHVTEN